MSNYASGDRSASLILSRKTTCSSGPTLDMIDMERGVKLAGTRNYFLKGDGAMLHWAVLRFAIDFMVGTRLYADGRAAADAG